ncbi:MAG: ATP-grasp domain-containing protein [Promethearchaeota archaeon]
MTVFLTNAEYKNSLAALRALVSNNVEVNMGGQSRYSLGFFSKLPNARIQYPPPRRAPDKFRKFLLTYLRKNTIDVLMPVGTDTFTLVSKFKEEFEKFTTVPVVNYDKYVQAHDKHSALETATKLNIPTPQTFIVTSLKEALSYSKVLKFPLVVKARKGSGTVQVKYAHSKTDLERILKSFSHLSREKYSSSEDIIDYSKPILQEFLPGEIYDVLVLFAKGRMRAVTVQKRVLCYPVNGGSGALNVTVNFPELVQYTKKLMSHFKWHGVAMVEFKLNKDGKPHLLEVNPKFWGTLGLSISAGQNFPYLLYRIALEEDIPSQFSYQQGKLHGWPFPMGINHVLDSPFKIKSFGAYLQLLAQKDSTDIRKGDLTPLSWQLLLSARAIFKKAFSKAQKEIEGN